MLNGFKLGRLTVFGFLACVYPAVSQQISDAVMISTKSVLSMEAIL